MAELTYLNFDLTIEGSGEKYRVKVLDSPAGQAESAFNKPFSALELENFYLRVGRPRQGVRRLGSPEMHAAQQLGARLFEAAFSDEVYACFRASLNEALARDKGLRLRLRVSVPELNNIPWEYLYNSSLDRFLSLSVETPIVRYLDLPSRPRPLTVQPPLKVLAMISSPTDFPPLEVESEWRLIKEALSGLEQSGLISLERLERADLGSLQRRLRRGEVHIFHFIGHGKFDERTQDGLLLFENENKRGRPLSGNYLGTILHDHRPLRLVVLNACEGARTSSDDPYSGAAQTLVRQGIPAVVAMQFEITDHAAITFAREFYGALAESYPVDAALAEARKAIFAQGNDIEWGTPVYFTRAPHGYIFNLKAIPVSKSATPAILDAEVEKRLERLYLDGLGAFWTQDWETAQRNFLEVKELQPDYSDVTDKLAEVELQIEISGLYEKAQAAVGAKDWRSAVKELQALNSKAPRYKDTAELLEHARKQEQLADLYEQARRLCKGKQWQAVIRIFEQIHALQRDYSDVEDLLSYAERELADEKRQQELDKLNRQSLEAMEVNDWERAIITLEHLLKMQAGYPNAAELLNRARLERKAAKGTQKVTDLRDGLPHLSWKTMLGFLGGALLVAIVVLGGRSISENIQQSKATETALALVALPTDTPAPAELPVHITDAYGLSMALVPAGPFEMGSQDGNDDEKPVHTVSLDAFYIDIYEVTFSLYKECVSAGVCERIDWSPFNDPELNNHPVIYVNWEEARTLCQWRGGDLPSEAQWEKAARGGLEGAKYPWGDELPVCQPGAKNGAQFNECGGETVPGGSFSPNGYGLFDMAGNLEEWVLDWYDVYPGGDTGASVNFGQNLRVVRGGSWINYLTNMRVAYRYSYNDSRYNTVGFRCARSP